MTLKSRLISLSVVGLALTIYNGMLYQLSANFPLNRYVKLTCLLLNLPIIALVIFSSVRNYRQILRWSICTSALMAIFAISYYIILKYNLISKFNSAEKIQAFLAKYGAYAGLIYILIQFLQVTIIPVPAAITTVAGVALFGFWQTFLYSIIGIMCGSMFAFFLGRRFGVKLIIWLCGQSVYEKYTKLTKGKDKIVLTMMFLFPFFPDDLLCIAAGITDMKYWEFFVIMLFTRPINILIMEGAFKGISSIPLTGYGIPIWIALIGCSLAIVAIAFKYCNNIEDILMNLFDKISSKFHRKSKVIKTKGYSNSPSCYDKNNILK